MTGAAYSWEDQAVFVRDNDASVQRLARLSNGQRLRLARRIGSSHHDAASLVDRLAQSEAARRILEGLDVHARGMARLFAEAVDPLPVGIVEAELARRRGRLDLARGYETLLSEGLAVKSRWAGGAVVVGLVPPLSRGVRPYLWLLGDERGPGSLPVTDPAVRASVELASVGDLARALAAVASWPVRIPKEGGVHGGDVVRLAESCWPLGTPDDLASLVTRLVDLGILEGHGGRGRVVWSRAEDFFGLPPAARLPVLLSTDVTGQEQGPPGLAGAGHVRRLVAAALLELPAGTWARREALEDAVRLRILAADALSPYADLERAHQAADDHVHAAVERLLVCLETCVREEGDWVRLPVSTEGDADASWLVQPTHDIMVPPEVPPEEVVLLARVADLKRADTVAIFAVTPGSVARAVDSGLDSDEIIDRLSIMATHGLPEGLEVQVEGWARQGAPDLYGESGAPVADPTRELPAHLRPLIPRLPSPPVTSWDPEVAEERALALEAVENLTAPREVPA